MQHFVDQLYCESRSWVMHSIQICFGAIGALYAYGLRMYVYMLGLPATLDVGGPCASWGSLYLWIVGLPVTLDIGASCNSGFWGFL